VEELRGLLAAGVVPELLRRIFLDRRSGLLHLALGVERADIEFHDGYLTSAETSIPGAHLGDLLVQIGFLSARDRDACLEIAALSSERMGESLLRHRLLDPDHLAEGLALQLREVVARTLVWQGGVYTFTPNGAPKNPAVKPEVEPRLDPRDVLLDATWTLVGDEAIDALLGDLSQKVRKATDERLLSLDIRLAPADAFLLTRVDGELSAEKLLQLSPLSADEAKASLAGLLAVGAVEYVGATTPSKLTTEVARSEVARLAARINSSDPFEVLGVPVEAPGDEVRSSYLRLLRLCDPASTTDAQLKPILRHMSDRLADAYRNVGQLAERPPSAARRAAMAPPLPSAPVPPVFAPAGAAAKPPTPKRARTGPVKVSPPPRPPVVPAPAASTPTPAAAPQPKVEPSQAIEAAARAFDASRFHEALAILHDAIPHLQGRARRTARVWKARVLLAVENGARLAEEELKAAIAEDPGNADAHAALGGIYRDRGSLALAAMEYRKTLELQPRNVTAREALQQMRESATEPPPPPSSVLKRMFGR